VDSRRALDLILAHTAKCRNPSSRYSSRRCPWDAWKLYAGGRHGFRSSPPLSRHLPMEWLQSAQLPNLVKLTQATSGPH